MESKSIILSHNLVLSIRIPVNTTRYKFILPRCESFSLIELIASHIGSYNNNPTQRVQTIYYMYVVPTYQQDKPTAYTIYFLYIAPTYQQDKPTTYITIIFYINPNTIYITKNIFNFVKPISAQSHRIGIR
jgi:hypothetical protein